MILAFGLTCLVALISLLVLMVLAFGVFLL